MRAGRQGAPTVLFTLDDVRTAAEALRLDFRNPALRPVPCAADRVVTARESARLQSFAA